ncbi:MAG: hypothetical protein DME29_09700 [Verrucomicrobia bacterium]|nr:MAG: hypothetical protein DME29_09700 [Verrucomicrobiota bacterium]
MKPQPPVTKMRIAPRTSSGRTGARADFSAGPPDAAQAILNALESEWMFWLILGLAAVLRILFLGIKPPHFDEGINGWFVDQMVKEGFYRYDPTNYHGPLHFYIIFLFQTLFGRNLYALRLPVVLASLGAVWLALKYDRVIPRPVARTAALAMALSPGFIFYGRYSIHEAWLLLFSMMFIFGLLGLWREGTLNYLWFTGIGITGMILTKETYIIHIGCALIALPLAYISTLIIPAEDSKPASQKWNLIDLAVVCLTGIGVIVFFYSGTFFHWNGLKDLFRTFHAWFETGSSGHGHEKPWYYWLELIARYEWPICAGLILCAFSLLFQSLSLRFLAILGVGTFAAYSIIAYKTPWCIISIIWPLFFTFGAFILIVPRARLFLSSIIASILLLVSFGYAISLNYFHCSSYIEANWDSNRPLTTNLREFFRSEPYVYVQTYNDIYKLTRPLLELAHADPQFYHLVGHILRPSPYPLPWILGDFPRIGYYEHDNNPPDLDADFLLVEESKIPEVEAKLRDSYFTEPLTVRPYQDPSKLYFRASLVKNMEKLKIRTPPFQGFLPGKLPNSIGPENK